MGYTDYPGSGPYFARYIRIYGRPNNQNANFNIAELRIWGADTDLYVDQFRSTVYANDADRTAQTSPLGNVVKYYAGTPSTVTITGQCAYDIAAVNSDTVAA